MQLVENILEKIYDLPDGPSWVFDTQKKKYMFPVTLYVGSGRHIHINPEINGLLALLSRSVLQVYFGERMADFTNQEWNDMTKRAFGEALVGPDKEEIVRKDAKEVLNDVIGKLKDWVDEIGEREYVFGCDLCNIQNLKPLSIGAVLFEPRMVWLERIHARKDISKVAFSRIQRAWMGKALRERKFSNDMNRERNIIDAIGESEFVCSVTVKKAGTEAGRERALTAARLATTVIALWWMSPSYALGEMGLAYDRAAYRQNFLVFSSQNQFGWSTSWSHIPGGVAGLKPEDWDKLAKDLGTTFSCAGEVITFVANGQNAVDRPKVMDALFQALLWFHEGCREKTDVMAIVKYCAVLEALACKRNETGITKLVETRLIINDEKNYKEKFRRIYRKGRSETVHGNNKELRHDWSDERKYAEHMCRLCLLSCLEYATENPTLEEPKLFSKSQ